MRVAVAGQRQADAQAQADVGVVEGEEADAGGDGDGVEAVFFFTEDAQAVDFDQRSQAVIDEMEEE